MDAYLNKLLYESSNVEINLQLDRDVNNNQLLKIYQLNNTITLSDIMPLLDNMGLKVLNEETQEIKTEDGVLITVNNFTINMNQNSEIAISSVIKTNFEITLKKLLLYQAENDKFNQLIIHRELNWLDVNILRAYTKYLKQINFRYGQHYIENTFINHHHIAADLIHLFKLRHDPKCQGATDLAEQLEARLLSNLDNIKRIDEDTIIRKFLLLIKATLRTNFFQLDVNKEQKEYITFKINSCEIPDLPLPKPIIDTFVYSSQFEGIHLRSHHVARGGIRWSDRHDDYRSEVLGLMKAQIVKNSIIIPSGAKGGFIVKQDKAGFVIQDARKKAIHCYQQFIRGLLDITDNIQDNQVIHPIDVVCHDKDDTYLVVAADKGTADFSDIANKISHEYSFWLGDAFASGGSQGYDHKKLGITARGAWESLSEVCMN